MVDIAVLQVVGPSSPVTNRVFLTARDLDANVARALKMSTSKTNMAARYNRTIIDLYQLCRTHSTLYSSFLNTGTFFLVEKEITQVTYKQYTKILLI